MMRTGTKLPSSFGLEPAKTTQVKRALTDKEASAYIGMSTSWLRHGRIEGCRVDRIPPPVFIKIGRSVRYLIEDLDTWLEKFKKFDHLAQTIHEKNTQK